MTDISGNPKKIILVARENRHTPTDAERILWDPLRARRLAGLRFYRQRVIGSFIADFYCASARLIVEVDGDIHDYQTDYDEVRTQKLEESGHKVIRFRNEAVSRDLENVLIQIAMVAKSRIDNLTPHPSPETGEGVGVR